MTGIDLAAHSDGCLFCLRLDGGFRGREHPFPESLGNTEIVLPKGVVCDRCNNNVLSQLDHALLEWPPVKMVRTLRAIPSKQGKFATTRWGNATISVREPGALVVEQFSDDAFLDKGGGNLQMNLRTGHRLTERHFAILTRAIWKIALELFYKDHGTNAFSTRFHPVRAMVLGKVPTHGWVLARRHADPADAEFGLSYRFLGPLERPLKVFATLLVGPVIMLTELLLRDSTDMDVFPDDLVSKAAF